MASARNLRGDGSMMAPLSHPILPFSSTSSPPNPRSLLWILQDWLGKGSLAPFALNEERSGILGNSSLNGDCHSGIYAFWPEGRSKLFLFSLVILWASQRLLNTVCDLNIRSSGLISYSFPSDPGH